jgi:hypothetical protein
MERGPAAKGLMESCAGAIFASRDWPWGLAVRPLAPVRSTGRPAGWVIPATRRECAGWVPAGKRPSRLAAVRAATAAIRPALTLRRGRSFLLLWTTGANAN